MNDEQFAIALYDAYTSGYEEPRRLHYTTIQERFGSDEIQETDALADAFDLGCQHAQNDADKFTRQELLKEMAEW